MGTIKVFLLYLRKLKMKFVALLAFVAVAAAMDESLIERDHTAVNFETETSKATKMRNAGDILLKNWNARVIKIQKDELPVNQVKNEVFMKARKVAFFKKHNVEQKIKDIEASQPDLKWHSQEDGNIVSCETFRKNAGADYPNVLPKTKFPSFWIHHKKESCDKKALITYHSVKCDKDGAKPCSASVCCKEAVATSSDNSKGAQRKRNMLKMLCKLRAEQKYAEILEAWRVRQQNGVLKAKCDAAWVSAQKTFCYEMDRLAAVRDWCSASKKFEAKWRERFTVACAEYTAIRKSNAADLDTIRKEKALIMKLIQKLRDLVAVKPQEAASLMLAEIDAVKSLLSDKNQAMIEESRSHAGYTDKIADLLKDLWRNLDKEEDSLQEKEKKHAVMCEYKTFIFHRSHVNHMLCRNKEKIHVQIERSSNAKSQQAKKFCEDQIKVYKATVSQYKQTFSVFTKETQMIHHLHDNIIGWVKGEQKEYKCKK